MIPPGGSANNRPTAVQSFRAAVRFVCGEAQDAASGATAKTASLPSCARILTAISLPGEPGQTAGQRTTIKRSPDHPK